MEHQSIPVVESGQNTLTQIDGSMNGWMDGKYKHPEVDDCSC
jgi:hypothetical protein